MTTPTDPIREALPVVAWQQRWNLNGCGFSEWSETTEEEIKECLARFPTGVFEHRPLFDATALGGLRAECAGLEASVGHLSALVDRHLASLRRAAATMKALHETATPDEDTPDLDARIPAHAFRVFVDAHAELLQELAVWKEPHEEALATNRVAAVRRRAEELIEKTGMHWNEAHELALDEAGVTRDDVLAVVDDAAPSAVGNVALLDLEERLAFARYCFIYLPEALQPTKTEGGAA